MEVERHAGALYTTFLVDKSGAHALEFHGLYCWYLGGGLDTLFGDVLAQFSRILSLDPMVFTNFVVFHLHAFYKTTLSSEGITTTDHRAMGKV
jgi:hypothetical protein